jgi:hypothetical protein
MVSEQKTNTLIILEQSRTIYGLFQQVDGCRPFRGCSVSERGRLEMGRARNQNFLLLIKTHNR